MTRIWAIARHTLNEGIRMRLVVAFLIVLVFIILRLPFAMKGDGTLTGQLKTFLSYSLGAVSLFLGVATVFFSCASLTKEIETRTMHTLITKPVTRFEVLAGKWLGINLLNLLILLLAGVAVYGFAAFIKSRPVQFERDRLSVDDTVWTARLAASPTPPDFRAMAREKLENVKEEGREAPTDEDAAIAEYAKQYREDWMTVPVGAYQIYEFENLQPPADGQTVYQVRFKARGIPLPIDEIIKIRWGVIDPDTMELLAELETERRSAEQHQFLLRAAVVRDGKAALLVANPGRARAPRSAVWFEGENSLEILYRVGGFETNYVKALTLIFFRLAFLSAMGLFFGTFVSFPVAAFCVFTIFGFCFGLPWFLESVGANLEVVTVQVDPYGKWGPLIRSFLVPILKFGFPDFNAYDGTNKLIDGYYVSNGLIARSALHTLVYGTTLLATAGYLIFRRREIAQVIV